MHHWWEESCHLHHWRWDLRKDECWRRTRKRLRLTVREPPPIPIKWGNSDQNSDHGEFEPPEFKSTANLWRKGNSDHGPSFLPGKTQTMVRVNCPKWWWGWFLRWWLEAQHIDFHARCCLWRTTLFRKPISSSRRLNFLANRDLECCVLQPNNAIFGFGGVVELRMLDFPIVLRNFDHNQCF